VGLKLFGQKWLGGILSFLATLPSLGTLFPTFQVSYIWGSNRTYQDESNLVLFDLSAFLWPEIWAIKVGPISVHPGYATFGGQPCDQMLTVFDDFNVVG